MATVVRHSSGNRYVLLGTGFGSFQSQKPNWFLGNLAADTNQGVSPMACICDATGTIYWVDSAELQVESVDGKSASDILI